MRRIDTKDKVIRNTRSINIQEVSPITDTSYVLVTEKDIFNFVNETERIVRSSNEYRTLIKYLKDNMDMDSCTFFNKLDNSKVRIELHHEPFTLFDITLLVLKRFMDEELEINPILVAREVTKLHYENKVGLIPLSLTCHELVHEGELFVPVQYVSGEYWKFSKEYQKYLMETEDLAIKIRAKLNLSKQLVNLDQEVLDVKFTYINTDGFILPQIIDGKVS